MKSNTTMSAICITGLLALAATPGLAAVSDDFESYTVGQTADVANANYTASVFPAVGSIANGAGTTNVTASQVLEHLTASDAMGTRLNGSDITGEETISFDFRASTGDHYVSIRDSTNGLDGVIIGLTNSFSAGGLRIQVNGAFDTWLAGISDDWIRATIDLHIDSGNPSASSFDVEIYNLTQDVVITTLGSYTNSALTSNAVPLINQVQIDTIAGGGGLQLDNFTIASIPEPCSLALLGLGGMATLVRRRN